jgi:hypothetical protein
MPLTRSVVWTRSLAAAAFISVLGSQAFASSEGRPVSLAERIQGAGVVVVATPSSVSAGWKENAFGDRLIVSRFVLHVEEALKGAPGRDVPLDLEGGTLDGVTLQVSNLPTLAPGDRAVFFLDLATDGAFQPHLRGQGILKLDNQNFVKGSSLSLDEIRRVAASSGR